MYLQWISCVLELLKLKGLKNGVVVTSNKFTFKAQLDIFGMLVMDHIFIYNNNNLVRHILKNVRNHISLHKR